MSRNHNKAVVMLALLLSFWISPKLYASNKQTLTLGVPPILPVTEIQRRWQPVIDHLNKTHQLRLEMVFSQDAQAFRDSIIQQKPDFVILGPLQIVQAKSLYSPILSSSEPMHAIVVVPSHSPITSLKELNGKTLATPEVVDAATLLIVNAALTKENVKVQLYRSNTQATGFRASLLGRADAATADSVNFSLQDNNLKNQLRIIYQSEALPPLSIAARKNIPDEIIKKVEAAFISNVHQNSGEQLPFKNIKPTNYAQEYATFETQLTKENLK